MSETQISTMKCPKCGSEKGLVMNHARVAPGDVPNTTRCVAYCCQECHAILGIESNPIVRNTQLAEIKEKCDKVEKDLNELKTKNAFAAAGRTALRQPS